MSPFSASSSAAAIILFMSTVSRAIWSFTDSGMLSMVFLSPAPPTFCTLARSLETHASASRICDSKKGRKAWLARWLPGSLADRLALRGALLVCGLAC